MSKNRTPIYAEELKNAQVSVGTANTNEDGTGTLGTLYTAPSSGNGAKVRAIRAQAIVSTTAGRLKIFRHDGSSFFHLFDLAVSAVTIAAGTAGWNSRAIAGADPITGDIPCDITLKPGDSIRIANHNAEAIHVSAEIEEY